MKAFSIKIQLLREGTLWHCCNHMTFYHHTTFLNYVTITGDCLDGNSLNLARTYLYNSLFKTQFLTYYTLWYHRDGC
jgi:hypothetical protein